jgi:hypothetical protein
VALLSVALLVVVPVVTVAQVVVVVEDNFLCNQ